MMMTILGLLFYSFANDKPMEWSWENLSCQALELAAMILIGPLSWGWFSKLPPKIISDKNHPNLLTPIILVPGYSLNRLSFWALEIYLHNLGYRNIWAINNPILQDDIQAFIDNLHHCVEEWSWRNKGQSITLIGHSMGGLICRGYVEKYGNTKIRQMVSIGTPFKGTMVHRFGFGKHVHQMAPNREFAQNPHPPNCPHLCIWSTRDWIVLPSKNALLENANTWSTSTTGHLSMLMSSSVFQKIHEFLQSTTQEGNVESAANMSELSDTEQFEAIIEASHS